jgi:two-component system chemotaxis response regulator CheB
MNASQNGMTYAIVVIGGSAGALEPLQRVIGGLPETIPAALFVTTHVSPDAVSAVPHILARSGALFATHAIDGAPIAPGRIIVAPPGSHLYVERGVMRVTRGPKENGYRPSIDVLFRSAAESYGPSVCGVLLSGALDDGVAGMVRIRECGGFTIAQDPAEALFGDMPRNAVQADAVDAVSSAEDIATEIVRYSERVMEQGEVEAVGSRAKDERSDGVPSVYACPDCSGTLWELDERDNLHFRCRTGHSYNANSMVSLQRDSIEQSLWSAIRVLEERADLLHRLAGRARLRGDTRTSDRLDQQAHNALEDSGKIRKALDNLLSQHQANVM